jgi:secernin
MCDTFVAMPGAAADGGILFGKNSDREPNEAQVLEYVPPQKYSPGERVRVTYLEIPQAEATLGVLLSRPFWMWGAEMGANAKGVVIGNEAVWTRMPLDKGGRLTGMDLLRLALERGGSAQEALNLIVKLLTEFGQGGRCGYKDKRLVYHNSFLIADTGEAWVLETAAHLWAARRVRDTASISNGLTIGEEIDLQHPDLIPNAQKRGWLKKGRTFHFARCYADWFYTTFSASRRRQCRTKALLDERRGAVDASHAIRFLRDHEDPDYRPDRHLLGNRVCAHAANPLARKATQTTGSLVAHLKHARQTFWVTGTSAPCTGIFKPVWMSGDVLPDLGPVPGERYDPKSLWWRHEGLHREVIKDYPSRIMTYAAERDELEEEFLRTAEAVSEHAGYAVTEEAFRKADQAEERWLESVQGTSIARSPGLIYRLFWNKQNRFARLPGNG